MQNKQIAKINNDKNVKGNSLWERVSGVVQLVLILVNLCLISALQAEGRRFDPVNSHRPPERVSDDETRFHF